MRRLTLREVREDLMLTKSEFAKLIDVNAQTVGHWERGKNVPMRFRRKITFILRDYDYDIDWNGKDREYFQQTSEGDNKCL